VVALDVFQALLGNPAFNNQPVSPSVYAAITVAIHRNLYSKDDGAITADYSSPDAVTRRLGTSMAVALATRAPDFARDTLSFVMERDVASRTRAARALLPFATNESVRNGLIRGLRQDTMADHALLPIQNQLTTEQSTENSKFRFAAVDALIGKVWGDSGTGEKNVVPLEQRAMRVREPNTYKALMDVVTAPKWSLYSLIVNDAVEGLAYLAHLPNPTRDDVNKMQAALTAVRAAQQKAAQDTRMIFTPNLFQNVDQQLQIGILRAEQKLDKQEAQSPKKPQQVAPAESPEY
jgi:hypothetical protein